MPAPPKGELFAVTGRFLIAPEALATRLTACALSVTYGDSSPKGRAKYTTGHFLISPKALATSFTAWLSLRGKTSPAPGEDVTAGDKKGNLAREHLRGLLPLGGAVAQRLRGYGWRSEKSVKVIAPTGAALAFLCFDFCFRIVKGVQPLETGCGTQHPLRALGGTRVLLAAAPTTPPCFRRCGGRRRC